MNVVIIGGGAGGAGAAARIRRLDEKAKITIFERSSYASYSNCALPYKFSNKVKNFMDLIMISHEQLCNKYNLNVKINHEVIGLNIKAQTVLVKNLTNNETFEESYDKLIIAAGAPAKIIPIPGIEQENVFTLKTPDDVMAVETYIKKNKVKSVVIIGGGYIGMEIAENFTISGYDVTVVDAAKHLMVNTLDVDFAAYLNKSAKKAGLKLIFNKTISKIDQNKIILNNQKVIAADIIFMTAGVQPQLEMYQKQGVKIGKLGGITVNNKQETNIKNIYAIGDIIETINWRNEITRMTLAFPASRQAVVAANNICNYKGPNGQPDTYKGATGAATLSLFDVTIASVGYTEARLKAKKIKYQCAINARSSCVGMMEGSGNIFLKVLYDENFKILGAQTAGPKSSEKRISYVSLAMMVDMNYLDFENFMVAYSPTVDTSFDATTMSARIVKHQADGSLVTIFVDEVEEYKKQGYEFIDVREVKEWGGGIITGAKKLAWSTIRGHLNEFDKNKKYVIYCRTGARSYNVCQLLKAHDIKHVVNLGGGYSHYKVYRDFGNVKEI